MFGAEDVDAAGPSSALGDGLSDVVVFGEGVEAGDGDFVGGALVPEVSAVVAAAGVVDAGVLWAELEGVPGVEAAVAGVDV